MAKLILVADDYPSDSQVPPKDIGTVWKLPLLAGKHNPDLIILDFSMPMRNGAAAARELKKLFPHIPIILLLQHALRPVHGQFTCGERWDCFPVQERHVELDGTGSARSRSSLVMLRILIADDRAPDSDEESEPWSNRVPVGKSAAKPRR